MQGHKAFATNEDGEMELSKTTINYAMKRGLIVDIEHDRLWIFEDADASEPLCIYNVSVKGDGFFWKCAPKWLPKQIKEELPYWIVDEKMVRRVVDFLAQELKTIATIN